MIFICCKCGLFSYERLPIRGVDVVETTTRHLAPLCRDDLRNSRAATKGNQHYSISSKCCAYGKAVAMH